MGIRVISLVLLCAFFDRARGGGLAFLGDSLLARLLRGKRPFPPTPILLYGWAVAALCGYPWDGWLTVAIMAGWVLGERPGWGAPIGQYHGTPDPDRRPEWWQVGPLRTNPLAALFVRGAIWGLPVLLLTAPFGVPVWQPLVAMTLAFPAAEWLAERISDPQKPKSWAGAWNEFYRGGVFGAILAAISRAA